MRVQTARLTRNPIEVIPFGIDVDRFSPAQTESQSERDVLTIGAVKSLEPIYGMDLLIDAFARVRDRIPGTQLKLLLVGGGALAEALRQECRRRDIEHLVTFTGPIPYEQVHLQHQMLDIAVYPSRSESFGVAAVESQACGVPTVVTDVGGLPEVVDSGRTGLIVPPENPEALAAAIERLVRSPDMRLEMGGCARKHVLRNFAIEGCVDRLEAVYTSVVAK
jgi:L-malate glycosyltransferase